MSISRTTRTALARLISHEGGASLVELAFAAPLLALLLGGIVDLGQGLSERFTLQQAVGRGLELLQVKPVRTHAQAAEVDYSYVIEEAAAAAGVPRSSVTLTRWLECNNVPAAGYARSCAETEETRRYVRLRIEKTFEGKLFLGRHPMAAEGAVRIQ